MDNNDVSERLQICHLFGFLYRIFKEFFIKVGETKTKEILVGEDDLSHFLLSDGNLQKPNSNVTCPERDFYPLKSPVAKLTFFLSSSFPLLFRVHICNRTKRLLWLYYGTGCS